jgi:hypothetical protein
MGTIEDLRDSVRGRLFAEGDEGYDEARRVRNGMHDKRPRVVVRCENAGDVIAAVDFARTNELDLAVRGGGHSVPGFGTVDDGVVIDLSGMRGVRVDPVNRTARAGGGATWGDFNAATGAFGLATTGGQPADHAADVGTVPSASVSPPHPTPPPWPTSLDELAPVARSRPGRRPQDPRYRHGS